MSAIEVVPPPEARFGGELHREPGLNMSAIRSMFVDHTLFPSMCKIRPNDGPPCFMEPTAHQIEVGDAYEQHPWLLVGKYRHAFISTYIGPLMARDAMYLSGCRMVILANKDAVAEDILERFVYSYRRLPKELRMPLAKDRTATKRELNFIHGGWIKILSAQADDPGEGLSPDRFHISEWGITDYARQVKAAASLLPIAQGKAHARVAIESTFGIRGDLYYQQWLSALSGGGGEYKFHPVFLKWWTDPLRHRRAPSDDLEETLTDVELALLNSCDGMTLEHIQFRRDSIVNMGDFRTFDRKYPPGTLQGWGGPGDPKIPPDLAKSILDAAVEFPENDSLVWMLERPDPRRSYVVIVDPADFGNTGDYAGIHVFDRGRQIDVAEWEGREDPDETWSRAEAISERYNDAEIVVERNASAVLGAAGDHPCLWRDDNDVPGWYASASSIEEATGAFLRLHRSRVMRIRSKRAATQLGEWDGKAKRRRKKDEDGNTSHFELARTSIMAAWFFDRYGGNGTTATASQRDSEEEEQEREWEARAQKRKATAKAMFKVESPPHQRSKFHPPRYR